MADGKNPSKSYPTNFEDNPKEFVMTLLRCMSFHFCIYIYYIGNSCSKKIRKRVNMDRYQISLDMFFVENLNVPNMPNMTPFFFSILKILK